MGVPPRKDREWMRQKEAEYAESEASSDEAPIVEDIVECAASQADLHKKHALTPRHIQLGIRQDPELAKLFANCSINMGGMLPHKGLMLKSQMNKAGIQGGTQSL